MADDWSDGHNDVGDEVAPREPVDAAGHQLAHRAGVASIPDSMVMP